MEEKYDQAELPKWRLSAVRRSGNKRQRVIKWHRIWTISEELRTLPRIIGERGNAIKIYISKISAVKVVQVVEKGSEWKMFLRTMYNKHTFSYKDIFYTLKLISVHLYKYNNNHGSYTSFSMRFHRYSRWSESLICIITLHWRQHYGLVCIGVIADINSTWSSSLSAVRLKNKLIPSKNIQLGL